MVNFCVVLLPLVATINRIQAQQFDQDEQINRLVTQWAPLIWLSPQEQYFPIDVDTFLKNVHLEDEYGKLAKASLNGKRFPEVSTGSLFLVTNKLLDSLNRDNSSFLNGQHPHTYSVPVYAVVTACTPYTSFYTSDANNIRNDISIIYGKSEPTPFFHVTYWAFYSYNQGKKLCFLGKVPSVTLFGTCLGRLKTLGSHVGDWEHMSLSFRGKPFPSEMYLAVHDSGGYYKFDPSRRNFKFDSHRVVKRVVQMPKFPPVVRVQSGHPVLFSANGSHGLWSAPGEHEYVKIPRLTDSCGYGTPWKTWKNVKIINVGDDRGPDWLYYKGKWGNPKANCVLFKKLGLCQYSDGPVGILRNKHDFYC